MTVNGHPQQSATGPQILKSVETLHEAIDLLNTQQQQIALHQQQIVTALNQLQLVVRAEHEETRRALVFHFSSQGLEKEHGKT